MTYPYPNPAPKKKTPAWRTILGVLFVAAVMICGVSLLAAAIGASGSNTQTVGRPLSTPTAARPPATTAAQQAPAAPTTPAAPAVPHIEDGTWTVGEDIPAGNYKVTGASETCYWAITKSGTNGENIISNHLGGGNLRVTLKAGQDFETQRCGTWQKV